MEQLLDVLERILPRPVLSVLLFGINSFSLLIPHDGTTLQAWLPLLITIGAIYWTIASAIRTATFAFRAIVFFLKYGALFAIVSALWTYASNPDNAPPAFRNAFQGFQTPLTKRPSTPKRPGMREPFDKHYQWRADKQAQIRYERDVDQGRKIVEGVMDTVWNSVQRFVVERAFGGGSQSGDPNKGQEKSKTTNSR